MERFENNTRKRLHKAERLSSKKLIDLLFTKGSSFKITPFIVRYIKLPENESEYHQLLVSVSKRNFKHAVDRNRIKRQIREAYRLNKHLISDMPDKYAIAYIYAGKTTTTYRELENKLIACMSRLRNELA
ncbi:MAG: ribonuclease P protein component [Bacteroidota bacterium]